MPIVVPDVGENLMLGMVTNRTAPENWVVRLFKNNITPSETDVAGTYTEATFPGYSAITLAGASWNAPASGSINFGSQQTYSCTGVATDDIYGYYVTQLTSGILLLAERDGAAPFAIRNNGDQVKITPALTAA